MIEIISLSNEIIYNSENLEITIIYFAFFVVFFGYDWTKSIAMYYGIRTLPIQINVFIIPYLISLILLAMTTGPLPFNPAISSTL